MIIEINNMLLGVQSAKELALHFKTANGYLIDKHLSYAMVRLATDNFPLDEGFYNDFLPILTSHVKLLTSSQADTFSNIVMMAGDMGVQDIDFWSACKEVLFLQRMQRYIKVEKLGLCIKAFAMVGEADATVLQLLGDQVIKHKKVLHQQVKNDAKQGFQIAEIGLAEFKRALEDDEETGLTLAK